MGAIGWIWAWLMLLGGLRAHQTHALPPELVWSMILSGLATMPLLWNRDNGLFASMAPSAVVRALIAVMLLVGGGISHPGAVMGLIA